MSEPLTLAELRTIWRMAKGYYHNNCTDLRDVFRGYVQDAIYQRTIAVQAERIAELTQQLAQLSAPAASGVASDAPDSPGWFAFEGHWSTHRPEKAVIFHHIYDVYLMTDGELYFQMDNDGHPIGELTGKWWRVQLPWDAQRTPMPALPQAPGLELVPDANTFDFVSGLLYAEEQKLKLLQLEWDWVGRRKVLEHITVFRAWLKAQRPAAQAGEVSDAK